MIETRVISGKGEILFTGEGSQDVYRAMMYVDVIRRPKNEYINLGYAPFRSQYAEISFMVGNYVLSSVSLQYTRQVFEIGVYQSSQNMLSMICMYEGILDSFLELATCIAECVPISKTNLIREHPVYVGNITGARIQCYADTAIRVVYSTNDLERCNPEDGNTPPPPPSLPPVDPPVPPGTPLTETAYPVDPPYTERPENTVPYPGDEEPQEPDPEEDDVDPPLGADCARVAVTARIFDEDSEGNEVVVITETLYLGPVTGYGYVPGTNPGTRTWGVYSRGNAFTGCGEPGHYNNGELFNSSTGRVEILALEQID